VHRARWVVPVDDGDRMRRIAELDDGPWHCAAICSNQALQAQQRILHERDGRESSARTS
jgi:hypothetical protein